MKHQTAFTIFFSFIMAAFLLPASTYAGFAVRLEKDVAYGEINMANAEDLVVTFNIYDAVDAVDPVATQEFQPGQWWAEYGFTIFRVPTSPWAEGTQRDLVRFKADFTDTDGLTRAMDELWIEIKLNGNVVGGREILPSGVWALFSEEANYAVANGWTVHEIYTGDGFDSGLSGPEQSHELLSISGGVVENYVKIRITANVRFWQNQAATEVKIQCKEIGGSYDDIIPYFAWYLFNDNLSSMISQTALGTTYEYIYTPTTGEKTNGMQFKIFSRSSGVGTAYIINAQTVVEYQ